MLRQAFYNFLFLILLASYQVANASVSMEGTVSYLFTDTEYFSDSADGELTSKNFANGGGPRYRGIADSELGILKAEAYSPYGAARIKAHIRETVTFQDVSAGDVGHISFLMQGSFELEPEDPYDPLRMRSASARFSGSVCAIASGRVCDSELYAAYINNFGYDYPSDQYPCIGATSCESTDSVMKVITLSFALEEDTDYVFGYSIDLNSNGYSADFSHTIKAYMELPEGVTYTSDSGVFLNKAVPFAPVPLPNMAWLFAATIAPIFFRKRS